MSYEWQVMSKRCKGNTYFWNNKIFSAEYRRIYIETSVGFVASFNQTSSSLRATRPFRDLKECDGTHSERCVRRVPTLRNKHEHRIRKAHLLPSCIIAVALCFHLSVCLTPLYIIVVLNTQSFDVLVPKIVIYTSCYLLNCKKKRRCLKWTSPLEIAADC